MHKELPADLRQAIAEVVTDRAHGASELARRALEIVGVAAREQPADDADALRDLLYRLANALTAAHPSMAPIYNLLACWREEVDQIEAEDLAALRTQSAQCAEHIAQASRRAVAVIAKRGAQLVRPGQTIITHSLSSTVVAILGELTDRQIKVIVTEARPRCEGYQLAKQLSAWAIPTTLITDAQMGFFIQAADVALVGADSLLPDGGVVNKAGTYLLALAAKAHDRPFYVCCESFKRRRAAMPPLELEAMDPTELGAPVYAHVIPKNIYFEVTPAQLVTDWINER
ncbi:MAG: translation initiation factor eIF-2B [Caldilineaceae bacterium]